MSQLRWTFRRDGEELGIEARLHPIDGLYTFLINWPDGRKQYETFATEQAFRRRLLGLEGQLAQERWIGPGDSIVNDVADAAFKHGD